MLYAPDNAPTPYLLVAVMTPRHRSHVHRPRCSIVPPHHSFDRRALIAGRTGSVGPGAGDGDGSSSVGTGAGVAVPGPMPDEPRASSRARVWEASSVVG